MREGLVILAATVVLGACTDDGDTAPVCTRTTSPTTPTTSSSVNGSSFCERAVAALDADTILANDGNGLVDELRAVDTNSLDAEQRRHFDEAVGNLEASLEAWNTPAPSHLGLGGWSTQEVTARVGTICRVDVPAVFFTE